MSYLNDYADDDDDEDYEDGDDCNFLKKIQKFI